VGRYVVHDLRRDVFDQFLRLPVRFFDHQAYGNLLTRLTYHVEQVAEAATTAVTTLVREGFTAIGLICLMFYLNWQLALFVMAAGPVVAVIVRTISRRFRAVSANIQDSMGNVTHVGEEVIAGHRVVKIFGGEEYEREHFRKVNDKTTRFQIKFHRIRAASSPVVHFVTSWVIAGVVYYSTSEHMLETITPGTFVAFFGAMIGMSTPIKALTNVNATLQKGIAAAGNIFDLLAEPAEDQGGERRLERARGELSLQKVGFIYPHTERRVLEDLSLEIRSGQTVAFVGRSGAGKSTLLSLLPRFYDPTEGCIALDGHDTREYRLADLRRQIAYVPQAVNLFNDTIACNIAYGDMAGAPEEQIIDAAKRAHAWEFIEKYPEGIHTLVGQNGVLLSGGQRQRLAIARALLKNAPLLLLDEATSALDTESERKIQQALEYLMQKCTTLVIAHRLSTIQRADVIVVMDHGRAVQIGRHEELLAQGGLYAELHRMQFEDIPAQ
jgi:subfamily B ATP-binding cassette protein MsbA